MTSENEKLIRSTVTPEGERKHFKEVEFNEGIKRIDKILRKRKPK